MNKESLRKFWYSLSPKYRFTIRRLYYFPADLRDKIQGKRHKYVPPRGSIYTGSPANAEAYIDQGRRQLQLLKQHINLKPDDAILDIGSGIGRTAIALTEYLKPQGSYTGFDVVKLGVDWCNSKIGKDHPNFQFEYIPLFNDLYNTSDLKAEEFVFPYNEDAFDKVFSFSVFTHMQIDEIQNYFKETYRVLRKDGLAFSTFFLYDDHNENYISTDNKFKFPIKKNGFRLMNDDVKSGNIAIHKATLKAMLAKENLEAVTIIDGFWKNKSNYSKMASYQDVVVFRKI
ncbi:class I SAM-dependent methyltransferase [Psychroserpens mesophilus]|uniref:class I SAM-dependent methyltransferase n=1 Tax=Psychroserpens mesophilus TaxID=325473 RepID=UPI00058EC1F3|nr:class I SAM-dependent methyltransferase [Psychroserpens mesophilus]